MASLFVFTTPGTLSSTVVDRATEVLQEKLADKGFDAEVLVLTDGFELQAVVDDLEDDEDEWVGVDDSFQDSRISTVTDDDLDMLVDWLNLGLSTMGYTEEEILDELYARE